MEHILKQLEQLVNEAKEHALAANKVKNRNLTSENCARLAQYAYNQCKSILQEVKYNLGEGKVEKIRGALDEAKSFAKMAASARLKAESDEVELPNTCNRCKAQYAGKACPNCLLKEPENAKGLEQPVD